MLGTERPNEHFTSGLDMEHCPITCACALWISEAKFFSSRDTKHTTIWNLIFVQLQNTYCGAPMGSSQLCKMKQAGLALSLHSRALLLLEESFGCKVCMCREENCPF